MKNSIDFSVLSSRRWLWSLALFALALSLSASQLAPLTHAQEGQKATAPAADGTSDTAKLVYPESKKVEVVDDYFGTKVADPYRWLENEKTP